MPIKTDFSSLIVIFCFIFVVFLSISCTSPQAIRHPVAKGDTYFYYATFYGDEYQGKTMANGEAFSNDAMTCAAKGFPFGTVLEVKSLDSKNSVRVTVTDRPGDEVIDLTQKAFGEIDRMEKGKIRVKIKVVELSDGVGNAAAEPEKSVAKEETPKEKAVTKSEELKKAEEPEKQLFYAISLASFGNIDGAKSYQGEIKEENTYIFAKDGKFEVRYGRYTSESEAKADMERFSWKDAEVVLIEE